MMEIITGLIVVLALMLSVLLLAYGMWGGMK